MHLDPNSQCLTPEDIILEMLIPIWGNKIIIRNANSHIIGPIEDDDDILTVILWSGSDLYMSYDNPPPTLYGLNITSTGKMFMASYKEGALLTPEGVEVAEVIGNTIYILYNISTSTKEDIEVLTIIMDNIYKMLPMTRKERIAYTNRRIKEYDISNELLTHKDVHAIIPTKDSINIFTNNIICNEPRSNQSYDLGRFRILIKLNLNDRICNTIRMFNLTRQVDGYMKMMHHPHILYDGSPCFGNMVDPFRELYSSGNISILINMLIAFLKTINIEDESGGYIDRWPLHSEVQS